MKEINGIWWIKLLAIAYKNPVFRKNCHRIFLVKNVEPNSVNLFSDECENLPRSDKIKYLYRIIIILV
jgi:hypothetical protein